MASNICNWAGLWEAAPDLDSARTAHTATVLKNGKILICGGVANAAVVGTALLYDPATRTYASAGSLAVARHSHRATRLKDGNVLVTGGFSPAVGQLASAELYNWLAGTWSQVASPMTSRRQDHSATLTNNGDVLLAGGFGGTQPAFSVSLDTIELFVLTTSTFVSISHKMQHPRMGHSATMQENGAILVAGGTDGFVVLKSAETYHPSHPPFNPVGNMLKARAGHTATLLPGSGVLLIGGSGLNSVGTPILEASTESFDGTSFVLGNAVLATARTAHEAVELGNGQVLVVGGEGAAGPLASAELLLGSSFRAAGSMTSPRSRAAAAPTGDGGVLVCGGKAVPGNSGGEVASSELFDPLFRLTKTNLPANAERFTVTRLGTENAIVIGGRSLSPQPHSLATVLLYKGADETFTPAGAIATARFEHTATLLASPDRILVVGGTSSQNQQLASAELFDLGTSSVVPVGQPSGARTAHTATLLPDGRVLIAGGFLNGTPLNTAELYDPATNSFSATGSLTYGRGNHTATLLPGGRVLLAGGMSTDSASPPPSTGITFTTEIYDSATGTFTLQPQPNRMLVNRSIHTATVLSNGKVLFAGGLSVSVQPTAKAELYDPATNAFTLTGSMAGPRFRHTATLTAMPDGQVMIVGGFEGNTGPKNRVVELYDPAAGTFSAKGESWFARTDHGAVLTSKQQVLVIGGSVDGLETTAELSKPTDCTIQNAPPTSSCFIATAAFGSELHPEVARLREYRDRVLMANVPGRLFVRAYYRCSPPIARLVGRSTVLRAIVRRLLR